MNVQTLKRLPIFIPLFFLAWGLFFSFRYFWNGFDFISGDAGDARFNALVLEHTWLWLKGIHPSLFNLPIFFPHPNAYSYSDFLLGSAPVYWLGRMVGAESLLAFQIWIISCAILNFVSVLWFSSKKFQFPIFWASFSAYVFSFGLPRIAQLGHAQLIPEFYIVVAAFGALSWWKSPSSKTAPFLFLLGTALQLLTGFYFFWFWIWTLAVYAIYILISKNRRNAFASWLCKLNWNYTAGASLISAGISFPFIWHYLLSARELGLRGWVAITSGLPRIYSWLAVPGDHWEWQFTPFPEAIWSLPHPATLPYPVEHYLSLGLFTWIMIAFSIHSLFRKKNDRYLAVPILFMFILSLCIGRISLWILMAYGFPGGGAIRSATRIQIFMLLFWAIILSNYLKAVWDQHSKNVKFRALIALALLGVFLENTYTGTLPYLSSSRSNENRRIEKIIEKIPVDCQTLYYTGIPKTEFDEYQLDAMRAAFKRGISTVNGYSGNTPKAYSRIFSNDHFNASEKLAHWSEVHPELRNVKICSVDFLD